MLLPDLKLIAMCSSNGHPFCMQIIPCVNFLFILHCVRQAGAGMVWEKNTVGLAGAGAGGWSGVRGKYCWAGAGAGCRTVSDPHVNQLPIESLEPHRLHHFCCAYYLFCELRTEDSPLLALYSRIIVWISASPAFLQIRNGRIYFTNESNYDVMLSIFWINTDPWKKTNRTGLIVVV